MNTQGNQQPGGVIEALVRRHLRFGWWSLLFFLGLGMVLEGLHGFKVRWYMDVSNETRRLMWTLAHAHGTLLGLIHIAFGLTARTLPEPDLRRTRVASPCLLSASFLLPGGFFLGGIIIYGGDPGAGILLVPVGAALLFVGVFVIAAGIGRAPRQPTLSGNKKGVGHPGAGAGGDTARDNTKQTG